jgi:hypothetical protein
MSCYISIFISKPSFCLSVCLSVYSCLLICQFTDLSGCPSACLLNRVSIFSFHFLSFPLIIKLLVSAFFFSFLAFVFIGKKRTSVCPTFFLCVVIVKTAVRCSKRASTYLNVNLSFSTAKHIHRE